MNILLTAERITMQSYQPEKRQRRAEPKQMPPAVKYRKKKRRVLNVLVCAVLTALVAIVVIVSPKSRCRRRIIPQGRRIIWCIPQAAR